MTKTDAIQYFGSAKALELAIGKATSTISGWGEKLPRGVQFEIQVKTNGDLKADPEFFKTKRTLRKNQH